jgi:hypothetical protein
LHADFFKLRNRNIIYIHSLVITLCPKKGYLSFVFHYGHPCVAKHYRASAYAASFFIMMLDKYIPRQTPTIYSRLFSVVLADVQDVANCGTAFAKRPALLLQPMMLARKNGMYLAKTQNQPLLTITHAHVGTPLARPSTLCLSSFAIGSAETSIIQMISQEIADKR